MNPHSKWLSVHLRTKWLWVRFQLQSLIFVSVAVDVVLSNSVSMTTLFTAIQEVTSLEFLSLKNANPGSGMVCTWHQEIYKNFPNNLFYGTCLIDVTLQVLIWDVFRTFLGRFSKTEGASNN